MSILNYLLLNIVRLNFLRYGTKKYHLRDEHNKEYISETGKTYAIDFMIGNEDLQRNLQNL